MIECATCGAMPPVCDRCIEARLASLRGVAASRGMRWADGVRVRMPMRRAPSRWPGWSASDRVREIARRKVAGPTHDDRLAERLAEVCAAEAARWWSRRRQGGGQ
ncbi:MAG: hypothetical protein H6708_27775 [Kofleriaceae bacterium]|nr:hypothetical protein [Kofleriaceae bacterium]